MKARGYKCRLEDGQKLKAEINDGGWTVRVEGNSWKPAIQSKDPIWVDNRKWSGLPESFEIPVEEWNKFRASVEQQEEDRKVQKEKPAAVDARIKKIAENVMQNGDVVKLLVRQSQRNHMGDTDVIRHLLASIASTNSLTSSGIQPGITGEKGGGKTDAARAVYHIIPDDWKIDASVTAKIPFYLPMKDGIIIFSDDVEWSPELIHTLKRSMGRFQTRQKHLTLDTDRNPVEKEMAARIVWWLSSVESVADDQLSDRQYSLDVEDGPDHAQAVCDYIRDCRSKKVVRFGVDWRIEVARHIVGEIKNHEPFKVVTPCAAVAKWLIPNDNRTHQKFWDLVEALAILRFSQRHIDADGWLYATKEDFSDAVSMFAGRKANHRTHLTDAQLLVVKTVLELQDSSEGATQATIAERLNKSQQAVSKAVRAIIANTPFLTERRGEHGEALYRTTVLGMEVMYKENFVTLPDDYNDLQPPYNQDTTNLTTTKTTNYYYNTTILQPNSQESMRDISDEPEIKNPSYSPEEVVKVVNSAADSDSHGCNEVVSSQPKAMHSEISEELEVVSARLAEKEEKFKTPVTQQIVLFLKSCARFMGLDGRSHGPFEPQDVASIPAKHAKNLIEKGICRGI